MGGHDVFVNPDAILPHLSADALNDVAADATAAAVAADAAVAGVAAVGVPVEMTEGQATKTRNSIMSGKEMMSRTY